MSVKVTWKDDKLVKLFDQLKKAAGTIQAGYTDPETAAIAMYNEFGTRTIPARPFLRRSLETFDPQAEVTELAKDLVATQSDPMTVYQDIARKLRDHTAQTINRANSWAQANAASTVKEKGSNRPLRGDQDRLIEDLSWQASSSGETKKGQ
jgi:hypothetical protein